MHPVETVPIRTQIVPKTLRTTRILPNNPNYSDCKLLILLNREMDTHTFKPKVVGSIPTAPTNLIHSTAFVFAFDTNSAFDTN